jgi:single-strand DNA-binding protein
MNLNKVILIGRVTKAPEVLMTPSGHKVAKISLATNQYQGKEKEDKTTFHNLVAWNKTADIAEQYVIKGQEIMIEGHIDNRTYKKKDGSNGYISEVVVERLQLGGKPNRSNGEYKAKESEDNNIPIVEDDINASDIPF